MARIVAVHGIGQELRGAETLLATWAPALRDGVSLAGGPELGPDEVAVAFYGDTFRRQGSKAVGLPHYVAADLSDPLEQDLLLGWWQEAADLQRSVPGPGASTKVRTPQVVQRALTALSNSRYFANVGERFIIGMIKQVHAYLTDKGIRQEVQAQVCASVGPDTRVIVAHSLGSVIAYEAVYANPDWHVSLVTLGSPLGVRNVVFDRLTPAPVSGRGRYPLNVRTWANIADRGDVVALVKNLRPLFGDGVIDTTVHNGSHSHDVSPYLTARETGAAILRALGNVGPNL